MTGLESQVSTTIVERSKHAEVKGFDSSIFVAAWASKIEALLKENAKIGLDRLGSFSDWGVPTADFFPTGADGRPRSFLAHEFHEVVNGVMASLGHKEEHSSVTSFFSDTSGEFAYQMRNFLRDEVWLRQTMGKSYPDYTLIPLGRNGIIMVLRQYFEEFDKEDPEIKSVYHPGFQYSFVGNFQTTEQVHSTIARSVQIMMTEAIEEISEGFPELQPADISEEEQNDFNIYRLETQRNHELVTERFIVKFNQFLDQHPQELAFLQFFLQKQIEFLSIEKNGKVVLYDTLATGKSLLTVAALLKRARPDVDVKILISSSKVFYGDGEKFYELADINSTLYGVANTPREPSWPFKFDGFSESTGLPEFSANPEKLLEWIMNVLFAYNRAVMGEDEDILEKLKTIGDQISDTLPPYFLRYVFPDTHF